MKVIEPSFILSTPFAFPLLRRDGIEMLRFIETQARISHRSEDRQTEDSWERFIKAIVLEHADWSVVEHASITATIITNRSVSHQLVRSRLFSYTQESQRFVRRDNSKAERQVEFIEPLYQKPSPLRYIWESAMADAEASYLDMLNQGAKPEEARDVLPSSAATTVAVTGNLRMWRTFFLSRVSKETQKEFRRISIPMLERFKEVVPLIFDDVEVGARQIDNARKPR